MADYYKIGQDQATDGSATLLHLSGELDITARDDWNSARSRPAGFRVVNARGLVARVLAVSGARDLFGA